MRLGNDIEDSDEGFPDHKVLRELIRKEIVCLILQKLDKLCSFKGGVMINSNPELELLATVHHVNMNKFMGI